MLDLIIRGGRVVTPSGVGDYDIGVQGEQIAAVAMPGQLGEAARTIDATAKVVIPGGVEPHAHVGAPLSTAPQHEVSGPTDVSQAALFGGTTTIVDFAYQEPAQGLRHAVDERHRRWAGSSYADYSYHVTPLGGEPLESLAQLEGLIRDGFPSVKVFTTAVRPGGRAKIDFGRLAEIMRLVAANGGIMLVHSEDDDMVQLNYEMAKTRGQWDWPHMARIHTNLSEDVSFRRVIRLAERCGAALYLVHVSAREGVEAISEARRRGQAVYGETLHNYASFTEDNYREPDGMKYHTYPSLKSEADRQRLWDGLLHGDLSTIATDHISTSYSLKTQGRTVADVTGGHNGIETRVGIMYSEGVVKRGMPLERFVDVTSAHPARLLGFYPRKGAIVPGSDADVVVLDPDINRPLSLDDLHLVDYSIWEGWPITGWPVTTILRGKVMVENGALLGQPGDGQLIHREIDPTVLSSPVC
jgi:dihydropyrimidinase